MPDTRKHRVRDLMLTNPAAATPRPGITLHVLDEARSPTEALIWTMWCAAQFVVEDDGRTTPPDMDFVLEREAHCSNCTECQKGYLARETLSRVQEPVQ